MQPNAPKDHPRNTSIMPLLSMVGVHKYFDGTPALLNASLEVGRGEVHALIGQNGAGKSTLIKILTGVYDLDGPQDRGTLHFDGKELRFRTPQQARHTGISTIYQEINLVPFASIAENIFLGREPKRLGLIDWKSVHQQADSVLAQVGLQIDVRQPVAQLSNAMRQMVAIAKAVSMNAKLVIMDEATSSLDEKEVVILFGVIERLRRDGRSVIFVSHRLDELFAICDKVTVLRDGMTVHASPMRDISKFDLVHVMLGKVLSQLHSTTPSARANAQDATCVELERAKATPALLDVSLTMHPGETVGLAGLLGSGRTETMRLIFGADRMQSGQLRFDNQVLHPRHPKDTIERGVAYLSEDRKTEGIFPHLSVRENLTMVLLPRLTRWGIVDRQAQRKIVESFIVQLGIKTSSMEQAIRELSGGNQQKVLLARWLALAPRVLLLDEPTRGIDVGTKADIAQWVQTLTQQGVAVLLCASELEELVSLSNRVVVLRDGRSIAHLQGADITEKAIMGAMADGDHTESTTVGGLQHAQS